MRFDTAKAKQIKAMTQANALILLSACLMFYAIMTDFERFRLNNGLKKNFLAEYLGVSNAFITQLVSGQRGLPEDKLKLIKANGDWDTSMLGEGSMLKAGGDNVVQVAKVSGKNSSAINHNGGDASDSGVLVALNAKISAQAKEIEHKERHISVLQTELDAKNKQIERLLNLLEK